VGHSPPRACQRLQCDQFQPPAGHCASGNPGTCGGRPADARLSWDDRGAVSDIRQSLYLHLDRRNDQYPDLRSVLFWRTCGSCKSMGHHGEGLHGCGTGAGLRYLGGYWLSAMPLANGNAAGVRRGASCVSWAAAALRELRASAELRPSARLGRCSTARADRARATAFAKAKRACSDPRSALSRIVQGGRLW
jgi:hypothetical protein